MKGFAIFTSNYMALMPSKPAKEKQVGNVFLQKGNLINEESIQSSHRRPILCVCVCVRVCVRMRDAHNVNCKESLHT